MINLMLGAPGGGKSYEAVVFHVLPALEAGRKVITNLPLNLAAFGAIDARWPLLIELRTESKREGAIAFAAIEDYGDPWSHPKTGIGPLYVIDECHEVLPFIGTEKAVEHWYAKARHENADVLLMTQSYGKINKSVRDLVQIVYRVRKNVAFGSPNTYTRKVQDGIRGEVVNTSMRKYEKRYFGLYRSHTKGRAVEEMMAGDIRAMWRHPYFVLAAVFLLSPIVYFAFFFESPIAKRAPAAQAVAVVVPDGEESVQVPPSSVAPVLVVHSTSTRQGDELRDDPPAPAVREVERVDPLQEVTVHLLGSLTFKGRTRWMLALSRTGAVFRELEADELVAAGYRWEPVNECFAWLHWGKTQRAVLCDRPQVSVPGIGVAGRSAGVPVAPAQDS